MFYVYVHTTPENKIYIGQTKSIYARWNNGVQYKKNELFYEAVKKYGWKNIKHEVVKECETEREALVYETALIVMLNSEDPAIGYNQTSIKSHAISCYDNRKQVDNPKYEKIKTSGNHFEKKNISRSKANILIEEWIYKEKHRNIFRDRIINSMSYKQLSEKYNVSIRQLKLIVSNCIIQIDKHL